MATRTVSNTGGNWNAPTAWVGGVVPAQNDDVVFTATSGNLVVNVSTQRLLSINFTNYVGTITFNNVINVLGTINLGTGGYTQAGSSGFSINGTSTLISNGVIWSRTILFTSGLAATFTLSDTWNVTGNITMSLSAAFTFNGNTLNIGGSLSVSGTNIASGTTAFVFNGTGTWSHSAAGTIRNNVTINTAGTLTIGTNIYYNTGTLTYTAGTVTTTGSTLNISASTTLNTNGINWNNITITAGTTTLSSNLTAGGTLTLTGTMTGAFTVVTVNLTTGAATINTTSTSVTGNLTINGATSGTSLITLNGTGAQTWSHGSVVYLSNNTTVNKSAGTLTLGANIYYRTGTLTYTAGTVDTTTNNSTLNLHGLTTSGSLILATDGIIWDNVFILVSNGLTLTITLTNNFTVSGNISLGQPSTYASATITFAGAGLLSPTGAGDLLIPSTAGSAITLNLTSDITINNFTVTSGGTVATQGIITINTYNVNINGSIKLAGGNGTNSGSQINGSGTLIMIGSGTVSSDTAPHQYSGSWYNTIGINLTFNTTGTINIIGSIGIGTTSSLLNKVITYIAGNVDASTSTVYLGGNNINVTFNTGSMMWGNVYFYRGSQIGSDVLTLTSDFNMSGLLYFVQPSSVNATAFVLNGSGYRIYLASMQNSQGGSTISGTATLTFNKSGYWYHTLAIPIQNDIEIDVNGSLTLYPAYYQTGTLTYKKGNVLTKNLSVASVLNLTAACTLINCHKINFNSVVITAGITVTMNEFFSGSPGFKSTIASTGTNYTITFQDRFEKFSKFVKVSRATLSNPGQLTVITDKGNQGNNVGIKFAPNQLANGLAKNTPSVQSTPNYGLAPSLLMTDPTLS